MTIKRLLTGLIALLSFTALLAGCGDGGNGSGSSNGATETVVLESKNGVASAFGLFTLLAGAPPTADTALTVAAGVSNTVIPANTTFTITGAPPLVAAQPVKSQLQATAAFVLGAAPAGLPVAGLPVNPPLPVGSIQLTVSATALPAVVFTGSGPITFSMPSAAPARLWMYNAGTSSWSAVTAFVAPVAGTVTFTPPGLVFNNSVASVVATTN